MSIPVVLVGAGRIAGTYAEILSRLPAFRLVAVVDPERAAAQAVAGPAGARDFASVEQLRAGPPLQAALVCTPPAAHAPAVRALLQQGLHVLCEKPLCLDASTSRELFALAAHQQRVLAMASKFRCVPDVIVARRLLAEGAIGKLVWFENTFAAPVPMQGRWNADPEQSGGGVLLDNGTHSVDLLRFVIGPMSEALALEGPRMQSLPVEDHALLHLRTADGAMGRIELSWSLDKADPYFLRLFGTKGRIFLGWKASHHWPEGETTPRALGPGYDKVIAFTRQLEDFGAAVRGEPHSLVSPGDAIASVESIEAAYASMRSGQWTPLQPCPAAFG